MLWLLRRVVVAAALLAVVSAGPYEEQKVAVVKEETKEQAVIQQKESKIVVEDERVIKEPRPSHLTPGHKEPEHPAFISGTVLLPVGLGVSSDTHYESSASSLEIFQSKVTEITTQISALRSSLKAILSKYQTQRNANMKVLIRKYKKGLELLRSDRLRIERLITCVVNPSSYGCGGSNAFGSGEISSSSVTDVSSSLDSIKVAGSFGVGGATNYPGIVRPYYPGRYPQYANFDWAKIVSQLAMLNEKYKYSSSDSSSYPSRTPAVNVFNGHSSYGKQEGATFDEGFSYDYGQDSIGYPGYYPYSGNEYQNGYRKEAGLYENEFLSSESSLFGGQYDFETVPYETDLSGYRPLYGYLIPQYGGEATPYVSQKPVATHN